LPSGGSHDSPLRRFYFRVACSGVAGRDRRAWCCTARIPESRLLAGFAIETAAVLSYVSLHNGRNVVSHFVRKERHMHKSEFWVSHAEAMEMSAEGNRLIAQEIAALSVALWHRVIRSLDGLIHGAGQHRQLPRA
jgi:hypothetical protein